VKRGHGRGSRASYRVPRRALHAGNPKEVEMQRGFIRAEPSSIAVGKKGEGRLIAGP
jgi:hypothetical protein